MLLTGQCQKCNAPIEFDPEEAGIRGGGSSFGKTVVCPTCGKTTPLLIAQATAKPVNHAAWVAPLAIAAVTLVAAFLFGGTMFWVFLWIASTAVYFMPSVLGWGKRNWGAIFALNFFLGWSLIGWVVALVWALTRDRETV